MFNFNEIENFDEHIKMSIPNYTESISIAKKIIEYYEEENTGVYDIGCSTGKFIKSIATNKKINYYGIDNSSLIPKKNEGNIFYAKEDIFEYEFEENASAVIMLYTMPFIPTGRRIELMCKIKKNMKKGGILLTYEKILSETPKLQNIITSMYYEYKRESFTGDEILDKEISLRESLRPEKLADVLERVSIIGKPSVIWQSYNFIGAIAEKE